MNKAEMNRHIQRLEGEVKHARAVNLACANAADSLRKRLKRKRWPWVRQMIVVALTRALRGKN